MSVSAPAFWVELSLPGVGPFFDDNYVSILPGQPWRTTFRPGPDAASADSIRIRSLHDLIP